MQRAVDTLTAAAFDRISLCGNSLEDPHCSSRGVGTKSVLILSSRIQFAVAHCQESCGMTIKSRLPGDVPDELPRELIELGKRITGLPAGFQHDLEPIYNQVVDSVRRRRRILSLVQDALSQLRLDIKYLMFDLEVTRRERDALRDQLADD
jgi:hypothetical protein